MSVIGPENISQTKGVPDAAPVDALIVDDEKDICFLLAHILEQKNIRSKHVNTLTDAEKFLEKQKPPVIFLDNHLPDGLGINKIRNFRSKVPACKIVMITAHDNASDRVKAREEGVDFFIGKPFTKDLILNTLEKIV